MCDTLHLDSCEMKLVPMGKFSQQDGLEPGSVLADLLPVDEFL